MLLSSRVHLDLISAFTWYSVFLLTAFSGDRSGRLLCYDPKTGEVKVLLRGLLSPNGVSVSKDGSFLVFCETGQTRYS